MDYNLQFDEAVLVECEDVSLDDGKLLAVKGNLILTNQNVIWAAKTMFGRIKEIQKYLISSVKVYDNKAQVKIEEKIGEPTRLTIHFQYQSIKFIVNEKVKEREFANSLNKIVVGTNTDIIPKHAIPGVAFIGETLKGTVIAFKNAIGIQKNTSQSCNTCGASISGIKGQIIKCPYCNSENKL